MAEQAPNPEQREQGPEYEVAKLVELNEMAQELYDVATGAYGESLSPSDAILDVIQELALAMVRRQGVEFGKALYEKLWERADSEGEEEFPRAREAEQHRTLGIAVDRQLFYMGVGLGGSHKPSEEAPEQ